MLRQLVAGRAIEIDLLISGEASSRGARRWIRRCLQRTSGSARAVPPPGAPARSCRCQASLKRHGAGHWSRQSTAVMPIATRSSVSSRNCETWPLPIELVQRGPHRSRPRLTRSIRIALRSVRRAPSRLTPRWDPICSSDCGPRSAMSRLQVSASSHGSRWGKANFSEPVGEMSSARWWRQLTHGHGLGAPMHSPRVRGRSGVPSASGSTVPFKLPRSIWQSCWSFRSFRRGMNEIPSWSRALELEQRRVTVAVRATSSKRSIAFRKSGGRRVRKRCHNRPAPPTVALLMWHSSADGPGISTFQARSVVIARVAVAARSTLRLSAGYSPR
jgi:hypothetical protein